MLRRLGVRGKVLAALSVPVLVLFALAGLLSWQAYEETVSTRAVQASLDALESSRQVALAMQDERAISIQTFGPQASSVDQAELDSAREETDRAITRYKTAAAAVDMSAVDVLISDAFEDFDRQLGLLTSVRGFVDGGQVALSSVDSDFADVIAKTTELASQVAEGLADRQLAGIVRAQAELVRLTEGYRHEGVLGREVILGAQTGSNLTALRTLINENRDIRFELADDLRTLGLGTTITEVVLSTDRESFGKYREVAADLDTEELDLIDPQAWVDGAEAEALTIEAAADELETLATDRASTVADATIREAILSIVASAAAVVLSIIIALSIARSIVRPLRRLTVAADTVRLELPHLVEQVAIPGQGPDLELTRIPVDSRDEIGRLAAAFNEVNETTIEVAKEQAALRASIAEMFVNVARRDQVLLNRQLSFIDSLERSEEDPKTLADLFRLDHLATRMRRNAESLLVLAGIDTGRRLRGSLPTSDVIRTASSEIEHYERIQLDLPVDPFMLGHVALPAAHMLAEVLENATVFSEPGTPVHVSTGIDESDVIITIEDQGLGMSAAELDDANTRIRATSAGDVLGSQRLGLFVVGRIASRLGVKVDLSTPASGTGTLVTVRFRHVLFVDPDSIPLTPPSRAPAVETFVRPEEAAIVSHDSAYVPSGSGAWDVPAGAVGSLENPAEEVNLVELTDGTTGLGLPRRRSRAGAESGRDATEDDDASAASVPLAPAADSLAGAAMGRTDAWTPPVAPGPGPAMSRGAEAARGGVPSPFGSGNGETNGSLPARRSAAAPAPTASGLPVRQPVPLSAAPSLDTASASGPTNVEGRTAVFAGFRSRRAELAAAAIHEAGTVAVDEEALPSQSDGAERLAATAAGTASFFGRHVARPDGEQIPTYDGGVPRLEADESTGSFQAQPMVIPALADDDDAGYGDPRFAPEAPAIPRLEDLDEQEAGNPEVVVAGAWQDAAEPWSPVVEPETQPSAQAAPAPGQVSPGSAPYLGALPEPPAAVEFAALVGGTPEPESKPHRKRRRLFGRGKRAVDADAEYAKSPLARLAAGTDEDGEPTLFAGGRGPVRRSVWDSGDAGSHTSVAEQPDVGPEPWAPDAVPEVAVPEVAVPDVAAPEAPVAAHPWLPQPTFEEPTESPASWAQLPPMAQEPPTVPPWANEPSALPEAIQSPAWSAPAEPPPTWAAEPQGGSQSWAPTAPDWSHSGLVPGALPAAVEHAPAPVAPATGATTFAPQTPERTFDDEMTNMLAQRADIAQQALSELSQLSMYRPQAVAGSGSGALVRRTPGSVPTAPEFGTDPGQSHRPARDAAQVRSLLSSFQSGTNRGRQVAESDAIGTAQGTTGDDGLAGREAGPADGRGQPVTTPGTDLDPRGTTW